MDWGTAQVKTALRLLEEASYEAYLVGGCVRDFLMGNTPTDYDITTNARPEDICRVFSAYRVIETGARHGTITVILDGEALEITTYRIEGGYTDHRRPDGVTFTQRLEEDLKRRDFTMNAMAWHPDTGVIDPFGGRADIEDGLIRCVGIARERFEEDGLRLLRALRFAATLGFEVEGETKKALFETRKRLQAISKERIKVELDKLLCGDEVQSILLSYIDVIGEVIPELLPMKGFDQRSSYHCHDVLTHTALALEHTPKDPMLRWAVLLHDTGKPMCFTVDEQGVGHFHGHNEVSAELAEQVLKRLKFDRASRDRIITLVSIHDMAIEEDRKAIRRWISQLSPSVFFQLLQVKRADNMAQAPAYHDEQAHLDRLEQLARRILIEEECLTRRDLALNGRDLLERGFQGKEVGRCLDHLLEAVMEEKVKNEKQALLAYLND